MEVGVAIVEMPSKRTTTLRVGIIGAGLISPFHAAAIHRISGLTLSAVCDTDLARARGLDEHAAAFGSWREVLAARAVDAVIVAVPHAAHEEIAAGFGAAGVHVLLEKPMATTLAGCDRIIEACRAGGAVLAVAHVQRFLPRNVAARRRIADGELGDPRFIVDRRTSQYEPGTRPAWFFDGQKSGGGIVMNVGIHCIDRIHYLSGARTVRVAAQTSAPDGVPVETEAAVILELDNGAMATIALTGHGGLQADRTEVVCSQGALVVEHDVAGAFRRPEERDGHPEASADEVSQAFAAQLSDFHASVTEEKEPAAGGTDGRLALSTVLAVYESAATGRPVQLN
jgi:predicted dehydrogenase